jgi:hypothetical protein
MLLCAPIPTSLQSDSFYKIQQRLGLTGNLQIVLDAGDRASYPGSGDTWTDLAPAATNFARTGASSPTFNGTANNKTKNEYFSFDGADFWTKSTANAAWMDNVHKDNAVFSLAAMVHVPSFSNMAICGTNGGAGGTGFHVLISGAGAMVFGVLNAGVAVIAVDSGAALLTAGAWNFVSLALDESVGATGIDWNINGVTAQSTSTFTAPSAGAASQTMQIGARGNGSLPLINTSRLGCIAMWSSKRTASQLEQVRNAIRPRFGI